MSDPKTTYDRITDCLVEISVDDERIRAIWIEAASPQELRRPYSALDVHLAVDEPLFPAVVEDIESLIAAKIPVKCVSVSDTQRLAKQLDLEIGSLPVTLIVEQSCYLPKRPRAWVVPLHDKTDHLYHVMDFSARR